MSSHKDKKVIAFSDADKGSVPSDSSVGTDLLLSAAYNRAKKQEGQQKTSGTVKKQAKRK